MTTLGDLIKESDKFSAIGSGGSEILAKPRVKAKNNYTILDDSIFDKPVNQYNTPSDQTVPPPSGYLSQYPPQYPPRGYAPMNPVYNSNNIIPDYKIKTMPSEAQQFINSSCLTPLFDQNGNTYVLTPYGQVYCPRQVAPQDNSKQINQYGSLSQANGFAPAGGVPMLPNALIQDQVSIPTGYPSSFTQPLPSPPSQQPSQQSSQQPSQPVSQPVSQQPVLEGFSYNSSGCAGSMSHISTCPMCQQYYKCDNRLYVMMILMLIVLFCIILFLALRK